jgi:hypothetical protein
MMLLRIAAFGALVALTAFASPASANDAYAKCSVHSGEHSAIRSVSGNIVAWAKDWLGISHMVVQDHKSGCKVYVLAQNTDTCSVGQRFEGTGRLRTDFSDANYDATLSVDPDKGTCR